MGTNYFWHSPATTCDMGHVHPGQRIHIGKSSAGWCFALHVYPKGLELGLIFNVPILKLSDWRVLWEFDGSFIENEYGACVKPEEMLAIITDRAWNRSDMTPEERQRNHAAPVPGPHGLLRHEVGKYCLSHGEGTWDLIEGFFE